MRGTVAALPRLVTVATLVAAATASWMLLVRSEAVMRSMQGDAVLLRLAMAMMEPSAAPAYLGATALMWIVMMVAMMTPAVLPAVVLFSRLDRGSRRFAQADAACFAGGYLLVWFAFALGAALLQWSLHRFALLTGDALVAAPVLGGLLLVAGGVYQLTPYKTACLARCQSPLGFLLSHWRDGARGAVRMGAVHGLYCIGCCWLLMLLMFAYGVMSAAAMAVLTLFILAERVLPAGPWSARLPGFALLAWGLWTLALASL